jgi:hypothetical protein
MAWCKVNISSTHAILSHTSGKRYITLDERAHACFANMS